MKKRLDEEKGDGRQNKEVERRATALDALVVVRVGEGAGPILARGAGREDPGAPAHNSPGPNEFIKFRIFIYQDYYIK